MLELFGGLLGDYLTAKGFAGAATVPAVSVQTLRGLLQRRVAAARDVLLGEIRRGTKTLEFHDADEAAAITYRYMRAAEEGAARLNLQLLARVIVGSAEGPGLYADEFLRWADILAGLRREEVMVLGVIQRFSAAEPSALPETSPLTKFWQGCWLALHNEYGMEVGEASAHAAALVRTGLVMPVTDDFFSGLAFVGTQHLAELDAILAVEGVLKRTQSDTGL